MELCHRRALKIWGDICAVPELEAFSETVEALLSASVNAAA